MNKKITKLPYRYRDDLNRQVLGFIYLSTPLDIRQTDAIESKLEGGDGFIPADLGLGIPELQSRLRSFPSDNDHPFHELDLENRVYLKRAPNGQSVIPTEQFVNAFKALRDANDWRVAAARRRLWLTEP